MSTASKARKKLTRYARRNQSMARQRAIDNVVASVTGYSVKHGTNFMQGLGIFAIFIAVSLVAYLAVTQDSTPEAKDYLSSKAAAALYMARD